MAGLPANCYTLLYFYFTLLHRLHNISWWSWWSAVPPGPAHLQPLLSNHRSNSLCFARSASWLRITLQTQFTNLTDSSFITRQLFKDCYRCYFLLFNVFQVVAVCLTILINEYVYQTQCLIRHELTRDFVHMRQFQGHIKASVGPGDVAKVSAPDNCL